MKLFISDDTKGGVNVDYKKGRSQQICDYVQLLIHVDMTMKNVQMKYDCKKIDQKFGRNLQDFLKSNFKFSLCQSFYFSTIQIII